MVLQKPRLQVIGNLNTLVRARGQNNDDGNSWSKKVDDDRRPSIRFSKRFRLL
jgi:hypothetical protein